MMKSVWIVSLALGACVNFTAASQSIEDKLCIFEAARKLPSIPGLQIISSTSKPLSKEEGQNALAGALNKFITSDRIEQEFGFLEYSIPTAFLEAKLAVLQGLKNNPPDTKEIRFSFKAAGQSAVISSICAVSASGEVGAWTSGIVE